MAKNIKKNNQKKKEKSFYRSTPKKKQNEKRNREKELVWIYKQMQGWFGFVDVVDEKTWEKQGYFVHESKKCGAFEGDEVAFEVRQFRWRPEADIKKVLKRSEHLIVWKLKLGKTYAFVISQNPLITSDIFIPGKHIWGYTDGSEVAVQILKWEWKNPEGRIIESLDALPKGREDIYRIAFEMWARKNFPDKLKEDIKKLDQNITSKDLSYRSDFRQLLTYTIDWKESKDLDDAISLEKTPEWYRLYVHIADVSHYIFEDSHLDREARKRGTSIYLADQVIPMLPKEISNGLCSLHPGEDKLTLTCIMDISKNGNLLKGEVVNSVIRSDFRLTYREVDEILKPHLNSSPQGEKIQDRGINIGDELLFWNTLSKDLFQNLQDLKTLTDILSKNTIERWALNFDFPETKVVLDDDGNPIEYKKYERYDSYKIIEECMVLANESVSKLFHKFPFLYRIHEDPDPEDVEKFTKLLEIVAPNTKIPSDFSTLLELLKSKPELQGFQRLLLRSLSKARYSEKNLGHFGLALKFYSHFTSPIRRYPDLQIHRIIKEIIKKKLHAERKDYYKEILPKIARRSSDTSERAEKMEYKVRDMHGCKYMSSRIGEEFTGKVSGMIEKGFFVELENTIEGFIEFWFTGLSYNPDMMSITSIDWKKELHFWDEVQVRVAWVDTDRYRVEFELV